MRRRKPFPCVEEYQRAMDGGCGKRYEEYRPMLTVRDVSSHAMKTRVFSRKFGRCFHFLSDGEHSFYLMLEWCDRVIEVREQYPLDPSVTLRIAEEYGIKHPGYTLQPQYRVMTSDFLVTVAAPGGPRFLAYQIKDKRDSLTKRVKEKLWLEQKYWERQGIVSEIRLSSGFNKIFCSNLKLLAGYRNASVPKPLLLRLSEMASPLLAKDCPLCEVEPCLKQIVPDLGELGGAQIIKLLTAQKIWECDKLDVLPMSQCPMTSFRIRRA